MNNSWLKNSGGLSINLIREEVQKQNKDISILGTRYNIKIINLEQRRAYFQNDTIIFQLKTTDNFDNFLKSYQRWYRELSEQVIKEHCNLVYRNLASVGIPNADIKIRTMKARWGSCYFNKNLIVLNRHLVQLPKDLIDHVILHEYAHFLFHNHGKEFKKFLKQFDNKSDDNEKLLRHKSHDELDLNAIFLRKGDNT